MEHSVRLEQSYQQCLRMAQWLQFGGTTAWLCAAIPPGVLAYWWYWYGYAMPLELQILAALIAAVITSAFVLITLVLTAQIRLAQKHVLEHHIRLDLYNANKEALGRLLAEIMPGIGQSRSYLAVAEEALKDAQLVTKRYADLQVDMIKIHDKMEMADLIKAWLEAYAASAGIQADATKIAEFVERHTPSENVTSLRKA